MRKVLLDKIKQTYPTLMTGIDDIKLHNARLDGVSSYLAVLIFKDGTVKNVTFNDAADFKDKCATWESDLK